MPPRIPFKARTAIEYGKCTPKQQLVVTLGATEYDVTFPVGYYTNILVDLVPHVELSWLTSHAIEPLPTKSDFKTGFRITFGAPAPAGATLSYSVRVTD